MGFLNRWFGKEERRKAAAGPDGRLDAKLAELRAAAQNATHGFQGSPLNKAGDLCLQAGEHQRALAYYGQAIDTYLRDGQSDAARAVANKIVRIHPGAVRTLCTLTWLDLAVSHFGTAWEHLQQYWQAAKDQGRQGLARNEILSMARHVPHREFLMAAAEALERLGFEEDAGMVRGWAASGGAPEAVTDRDRLANYCIERALGSDASRRSESETGPDLI